MPEPDATPPPADGALPTILGGMDPGELLARGMQSVKMSSVGAPGWEPPSVAEAAGLFLTYEVLAMLGRGGMGAVFKARQLALDRLVAIKLLPLEISVDRFRRGAHASRVLAKSSRLRALPHAPNAGSARHHSTRLGKFVVSGRHDQHAGRVRSPAPAASLTLARRTARSAVPTWLRPLSAPPASRAPLVTKFQLGHALVLEAPPPRRRNGIKRSRSATPTKQSFADKCVPKLELGNEGLLRDRLDPKQMTKFRAAAAHPRLRR